MIAIWSCHCFQNMNCLNVQKMNRHNFRQLEHIKRCLDLYESFVVPLVLILVNIDYFQNTEISNKQTLNIFCEGKLYLLKKNNYLYIKMFCCYECGLNLINQSSFITQHFKSFEEMLSLVIANIEF